MSVFETSPPAPRLWVGAAIAAGLAVAQLLAISLLYQHNFQFVCRDAAPDAFCAFAGRIVPRALGVLAVLGLFLMARPGALSLLRGKQPALPFALTLNLVGFALILAPWTFVSDASSAGLVALAAGLWSLGGLMTAVGLALMIAPPAAWRALLARHGLTLAALIAVGLALPELSDRLQGIWDINWVTETTFAAVVWCLGLMGYAVETWPDDKIIGADGFYVAVGPECSGVEGFALITAFLTLYMVLFRKDLRFPAVLWLFPVGIVLSGLFNVVRITALVTIGFEVSTDLAVGAFHSHAGWLAFTLLSMGLILVSRSVPVFMADPAKTREPGPALPPFFSDPVVAQVLPFIVFMASALLSSTFSETPSVLYPLRALAMGAALVLFWPYLRALPWRFDLLSAASGVAIAVMWIVTAPAGDGPPAFGDLAGTALIVWFVARIIGTAVLVPIIEEIFFRGYLMERIQGPGGPLRVGLAIAIPSALFAALHDRWIEAAIAGVIFGLLMLRSKNVTDAILSHAVANALIAGFALAMGAWHVI